MKIADPFNAWLLDCCELIPSAYLTREEAVTSCQEYCDEITQERIPKRKFYEKMRNTKRIKDIQKKVAGKNLHVFEGITFKNNNGKQTVLTDSDSHSKVAKVAKVANLETPQTTEKNKVFNIKEEYNSANSATKPEEHVFTITCFDCRKPLQKHEVYSFGVNKFCRECRLKIEAQKKKPQESSAKVQEGSQ